MLATGDKSMGACVKTASEMVAACGALLSLAVQGDRQAEQMLLIPFSLQWDETQSLGHCVIEERPAHRGLAAFSETAPVKCVRRTPAVRVSQESALYWSSRNSASR